MKEYYFQNNEFVIERYDQQKTFASFLPGLAGKRGIPLWAFYVNRGQGIASFGIENKDRAILEFFPAVKAYQQVGIDGFRTFIKKDGKVTEIFGVDDEHTTRNMRIKRSEFTIEEINEQLGLKITVTYFGLPNATLAALSRIVTIENLNTHDVEIELIDGLSQLLPTGVSYGDLKAITNLIRSWMDVYNLEDNVGFYRMRSSSADQAEVVEIQSGHFYVSTCNDTLVKPIADSRLVFGSDTTKRRARFFEKHSIKDIYEQEQVTANKIPVGFTGCKMTLKKGATSRLNTVIGHAHDIDELLDLRDHVATSAYLDHKRQEADDELELLLHEVSTKTAFPIFDDYIKQNYMDNILRGGYPLIINNHDQPFVYHLFSRRHGDLERDYNYFSLAPEFYSQGNGSFRDVCQNRRSDTLLNPQVGTFNMKMFASFIQADGYNPMSIDGSTFSIEDKNLVNQLVEELFDGSDIMNNVLQGHFTPGSIINTMANNDIESVLTDTQLFDAIFPHAIQHYEAHFGEGYWIDHWTYILDLVENYEAIYPDKIQKALYDEIDYKYFDSPVFVVPRDDKICLTNQGTVRRYGSLLHLDREKIERNQIDPGKANWLKDNNGNTLYASLFEKLFVLAVNKIATLDPSGMGVEMEADKPGWNDAMNGLPGLFGSGVSETIELKRVVTYLLKHHDASEKVRLLKEFIPFTEDVLHLMKTELDDFRYWDKSNTAKETYRKAIRFSTEGLEYCDSSLIKDTLDAMNEKIDIALSKALRFGDGIYPTYLLHEVTSYEPIMDRKKPHIGNYGLPTVRPTGFTVRSLPLYLEAPARALKVMKNRSSKETMYQRIKMSNIYDHKLKFYKTSEFLDKESNEIGRGRSFTKGWQERESNFLHMTYKYLLGLLKGKLYDEFYEEIKTNLTIFMDPNVYGRSTLENSSFIASSINPDPFVRGQGYVARLSGSTAEMLSIWAMMMYGKKPFKQKNGELFVQFKPLLHQSFFTEGTVTFTFLGSIQVTYHNSNNINTYDPGFKITSYKVDGVEYNSLADNIAHKIRNREVSQIDVYF